MCLMTSREDHQTDVSHHAIAIARWDDEGGASMSARSNTGARVSKGVRSMPIAETTAELKFDPAPGDDKKILECLGAAVIMRWEDQIARFLHNHKEDGARTTRTTLRRVVL